MRYRRGRWVVDFYDQDGKRRWETLPKGTYRKTANETLGEMERKVRQGTYTPPKELPPFPEAADSWLASKEPNIRHSTYQQYKGHIENHLKPYFERFKINQVTFDGIEKFTAHCIKKEVTPPTLRKILVTLGAILTYAVRRRYTDFNSAREVEKPRGRAEHREKEEMVILTPKEIQLLLSTATPGQDATLFLTAVLTGVRGGEPLGLQGGDID